MQLDGRLAAGQSRDFDIHPATDAGPAGAKSLHRGLLGGKPRGVAFGASATALAIGDLLRRKDARNERLAVARDGLLPQ